MVTPISLKYMTTLAGSHLLGDKQGEISFENKKTESDGRALISYGRALISDLKSKDGDSLPTVVCLEKPFDIAGIKMMVGFLLI